MAHTIDWQDKGVKATFSGYVSAQELEQANGEVHASFCFDLIDSFIWDLSDVSALDAKQITIDFVSGSDKGASYSNPKLKGALIAKDEQVKALLFRYLYNLKRLDSPWDVRLFDNLNEAKTWLKSK